MQHRPATITMALTTTTLRGQVTFSPPAPPALARGQRVRALLQLVGLAQQRPVAAALDEPLLLLLLAMHEDALRGDAALVGQVDLLRRPARPRAPARRGIASRLAASAVDAVQAGGWREDGAGGHGGEAERQR